MIAALTALLALPLGYLVRSRLAAFTIYAVAYLWAFTFQTLYLLLDSLGSDRADAFDPGVFPLSYGLVTAAVLMIGAGAVCLGHWLRSRRRAGSEVVAEAR